MEITIRKLQKNYKEKLALNIDTLNITKGRITGILGPNGAGKSTLLRIIAGLDREFSGQVIYNGKSLNTKLHKEITLVLQKPYLLRRGVYENIAYPLKIRKFIKEDIKKLTEDILNKFEINTLKDKKAHRLSGGESQKVSLARALVFKPKLLLLDEPTSNIDPKAIEIMEREIVNYNREKGATVLIITHNLQQARRICDEVVYLDNGRVRDIDGIL